MKLQDASGKTYTVHFQHFGHVEEWLRFLKRTRVSMSQPAYQDRHEVGTNCSIHEGDCQGKPCIKGVIGITYYNPADRYSKTEGRKRALYKALKLLFPKDPITRKQVKASYFEQRPQDRSGAPPVVLPTAPVAEKEVATKEV